MERQSKKNNNTNLGKDGYTKRSLEDKMEVWKKYEGKAADEENE